MTSSPRKLVVVGTKHTVHLMSESFEMQNLLRRAHQPGVCCKGASVSLYNGCVHGVRSEKDCRGSHHRKAPATSMVGWQLQVLVCCIRCYTEAQQETHSRARGTVTEPVTGHAGRATSRAPEQMQACGPTPSIPDAHLPWPTPSFAKKLWREATTEIGRRIPSSHRHQLYTAAVN